MIQLTPRFSEKSYALAQKFNTYVFTVPTNVHKNDVQAAVEDQFKVKVIKVNLLNRVGKVKKSVRKRSQAMTGQEKASKQAYVTLTKGDKITVFEEA
jgi:large subunit ribosomal protein L23